ALEGRVSDHDPVLLDAIGSLGTLLVAEGEVERAIPLLERVVKESRALPVERRAELANSVADLGYAEQVRGDDAGARRHYEESIALFATLPDSGGMDRVLVNLGYLADRQGQLDSAEMFFRRALAYRRARHGEAHTRTLSAMTALARTLVHRGVLDEAERLSGIVLAARQRALKGPHDLTSDALVLRAQVLIPLGRGGEAEALGRAALAMSRQLHGEVHLNIPFAKAAIADAVASQGRRAEALAIRRQVLADYRRAAGARHPATILAMIRLAEDEQAARRLAESEQLFREAMPALDSIWEGRPVLAPPLTSFGALLAATSRCAEAEPYLRRAAVLAATRWPRDDERVRRPRALLDECRRRPADDRAGPSGAARPDDR
ncbi:MAG TPA: tetratricopeptide repeat protein, partial [Gemmatimonadaceae bacterium]|nr:tetratricopeptide repeat protein [Gemmatimonadaceae bacterium]